jgi:hypothetical protein
VTIVELAIVIAFVLSLVVIVTISDMSFPSVRFRACRLENRNLEDGNYRGWGIRLRAKLGRRSGFGVRLIVLVLGIKDDLIGPSIEHWNANVESGHVSHRWNSRTARCIEGYGQNLVTFVNLNANVRRSDKVLRSQVVALLGCHGLVTPDREVDIHISRAI